MENFTSLTLKPIYHVGQLKVDHCGTSFMIAAFEILRTWPNVSFIIVAPKRIRDTLISRFHPHSSKTLKNASKNNLIWLTTISDARLATRGSRPEFWLETTSASAGYSKECFVNKQISTLLID
jgi:hypothetical protein